MSAVVLERSENGPTGRSAATTRVSNRISTYMPRAEDVHLSAWQNYHGIGESVLVDLRRHLLRIYFCRHHQIRRPCIFSCDWRGADNDWAYQDGCAGKTIGIDGLCRDRDFKMEAKYWMW